MKHLIVCSILMAISSLMLNAQTAGNVFSHGKLKVAENNRFITYNDGTPFFYLGDTAWELFHRLTKEDAEAYLENRHRKGFTVIQAVALAELEGLNIPNQYGEKPLNNNDPLAPNEKYFEQVDWVIQKAAEKGMFIGLLPTWGDKVDKQWGVGPVIFNEENAAKYGEWIANRYKNAPNIIWIIGGDRNGGGENTKIWNAMAGAINRVDQNHLMTYHPSGGSTSSQWFQNADWLDFNMSQTGHCERSYAAYISIIQKDYNKTPMKPCFDGEPRYEDHPVCWNPNVLGWFDDADVRQAAYWSLFSGSFGHTYGCHAIWQFLDEGREPVGMARHTWREGLDLPGSQQMLYVRKLMESRPFVSRVPMQELVSNGFMPETDYKVATKGDGYALVYLPQGGSVNLKLDLLGFAKGKASWYDPRTGSVKGAEAFTASGDHTFYAPSNGRGNDWILILDDATKEFADPSTVMLN